MRFLYIYIEVKKVKMNFIPMRTCKLTSYNKYLSFVFSHLQNDHSVIISKQPESIVKNS